MAFIVYIGYKYALWFSLWSQARRRENCMNIIRAGANPHPAVHASLIHTLARVVFRLYDTRMCTRITKA